MDRNLVICEVSTVILINATCSKYPVKALRPRERSQEEEKGGEVLLER